MSNKSLRMKKDGYGNLPPDSTPAHDAGRNDFYPMFIGQGGLKRILSHLPIWARSSGAWPGTNLNPTAAEPGAPDVSERDEVTVQELAAFWEQMGGIHSSALREYLLFCIPSFAPNTVLRNPESGIIQVRDRNVLSILVGRKFTTLVSEKSYRFETSVSFVETDYKFDGNSKTEVRITCIFFEDLWLDYPSCGSSRMKYGKTDANNYTVLNGSPSLTRGGIRLFFDRPGETTQAIPVIFDHAQDEESRQWPSYAFFPGKRSTSNNLYIRGTWDDVLSKSVFQRPTDGKKDVFVEMVTNYIPSESEIYQLFDGDKVYEDVTVRAIRDVLPAAVKGFYFDGENCVGCIFSDAQVPRTTIEPTIVETYPTLYFDGITFISEYNRFVKSSFLGGGEYSLDQIVEDGEQEVEVQGKNIIEVSSVGDELADTPTSKFRVTLSLKGEGWWLLDDAIKANETVRIPLTSASGLGATTASIYLVSNGAVGETPIQTITVAEGATSGFDISPIDYGFDKDGSGDDVTFEVIVRSKGFGFTDKPNLDGLELRPFGETEVPQEKVKKFYYGREPLCIAEGW